MTEYRKVQKEEFFEAMKVSKKIFRILTNKVDKFRMN